MAGLLVVGGQNALNAFTGGRLYPSAIRATGLGWALSVLRLGGVLAGSLAAGFVVALDLGPRNTFLIIAAPELLCGLGLLLIHLRRTPLPASANLRRRDRVNSFHAPHILVAGAGIGGLTLALALLRRGATVDVYEQTAVLRQIGAGVQVGPNGSRVLLDLGLEEALRPGRVRGERQGGAALG